MKTFGEFSLPKLSAVYYISYLFIEYFISKNNNLMHYADTIGQQIRLLREAKGYSQEYMADMLDVSQSTYACLESGKTALRVDRLFQILELLDTDIATLLNKKQGEAQSLYGNEKTVLETRGVSVPELKLVYDRLFQEMRDEILFLRSLVRKAPESRV
jgi:transcriptional regulator with XRE-family HTH domain